MTDIITEQNIRSRVTDQTTVCQIRNIERMPRVLDKPPSVMDIKYKGVLGRFDIATTIAAYYNEAYDSVSNQNCCIDLPERTVPITQRVYAVLVALIYLATHKDKKLAENAATLFGTIATCNNKGISDRELYTIIKLRGTHDYYALELRRGIHMAVYQADEIYMHWSKISYCDGWYSYAIEAGSHYIQTLGCITAKQLDKMLLAAYKEASTEKSWMSLLLKRVPGKPLIGMMWLLYPDDPKVLEPSDSHDFFMSTDAPIRSIHLQSADILVRSYLYKTLSQRKSVSVDSRIADIIKDKVSEYVLNKTTDNLDEILERLIISDDDTKGAAHVGKAGSIYVCTYK